MQSGEIESKKSTCGKITIPTGTKEWADTNVNICSGCKNDCRYCYAKKMAMRFGRKTTSTWKIMKLNKTAVKKKYAKRKGRIMFPSSHDITQEILSESIIVLRKLLEAGNEVLITSKPSLPCIQAICDAFELYQDLIQFRFTVGSMNDTLIQFWEPNAPLFQERIEAIQYAFNAGYKTSVSCEPFLDYDPVSLVMKLDPYITESIWIGKMNYIQRNGLTPEEEPHYLEIRKNYTQKHIQWIYSKLKDYPKIQWKDSIKKMLNLH